jgi:hypothetical protein
MSKSVHKDIHSIFITADDYNLLTQNEHISKGCEAQLNTAIEYDDEVELLLTLDDLPPLIRFIAAEASHVKSPKLAGDLTGLCDYLKAVEQDIKGEKQEK